MKKSLIFVGMLAIGFANAQDYDGKVGINTDTPSATLNVKTKNNSTSPKNLELENQAGTKLVTVLNRNGNVGINTETPIDKLHVKDGAIRVEAGGSTGGYLNIVNSSKPTGTQDVMSMWTLYNMTGSYGNSLQFWGYRDVAGAGVNAVQNVLVLQDTGNIGIGLRNPQEKLDVNGNARLRTLPNIAGADTDKVVVVDNTGVLKTVARSSFTTSPAPTTATNGVQNTTGMACNDANRGKMNFGRISISGKETDAMGFCMKNGDNEFRWYYIYGGAAHTVGTNATFGQGL